MVAGVPTKLGSAAFADFVPDFDDNVVTLLRAAGTISLGKTATPEFGLPCYTETDIGPPARTPWDTARLAGGSSGGAAAAVAGGFVPIAQGSDGGGSIRIPASVCGLVGLKTVARPGLARADRPRRDPAVACSARWPARSATRRRSSTPSPARSPATRTAAAAAGRRDVPGWLRPRRRAAADRPLPRLADRSRGRPAGARGVGAGERVAGELGPRGRGRRRADPARGRPALRDRLGGVGRDGAGRRPSASTCCAR